MRQKRILSAWLLTSVAMSAADVLVLDDGRIIQCRLLSIGQEVVAFEVCDVQLSLPRSSIVRIQRDVEVESAAVGKSPKSSPRSLPSAWTFDVGMRLGYVRGGIDVSGTIVSTSDGRRIPEYGTISLDGLAPLPGLALRGVWQPAADDSAPIFGVQVGRGFSSGQSASYRETDVEAVAGWNWRRGQYSWSLQASGGPSWASVGREMTIRAPGQAADQIEASAGLRGWTYGSAARMTYDLGSRYLVGFSLGLQRAQVSGTADWTSDRGTFSATEDLSARVSILYSGVILGVTW